MSLSDESQQRASLKRVSQYDAKQRIAAELEKHDRAKALEKQQLRRWKAGDVYAPHDLSPVEMRKWRIRRAGGKDVFDMLGINPLMEYKVRFLPALNLGVREEELIDVALSRISR